MFGAIGIPQGAERLVVVDVCRAVGGRDRREERREEGREGEGKTKGKGKNTITSRKEINIRSL